MGTKTQIHIKCFDIKYANTLTKKWHLQKETYDDGTDALAPLTQLFG